MMVCGEVGHFNLFGLSSGYKYYMLERVLFVGLTGYEVRSD